MIRVILFAILAIPALAWAADPVEHGTTATGTSTAAAAHTDPAHGGATKASPFAGTIAQSIAAILVFLIVFWILKSKAWGPILKGLNDREDKIRRDLVAAEKAHKDANDSLENYKRQIANADAEVRARLASAQKDAEGIGAKLRMQAQTEIEEMKTRATKELEAAKQGAMAEIHNHAATLATSVAEKILRRNINDGDQKALVQSSLDQLAAMGRN